MIIPRQILSIYFYINRKETRKHYSVGSDVFRTVVDVSCVHFALIALLFGLERMALNILLARFALLLPLVWYFAHLDKVGDLPEKMEEWQNRLMAENRDKNPNTG